MATKKLLVLTPKTTDGVNLMYNDDKQPVFKQSIVELKARRNFESLNAKLPKHLQHTFQVIEVEDAPTGATNEDLKKQLADLETEKENRELKAKIAELQKENEALSKGAEGGENAEQGEKAAEGEKEPKKIGGKKKAEAEGGENAEQTK